MTKLVDWTKLEEKPYEEVIPVAREIATEGAVLLKNENGVLPVKSEEIVSVFGRTQIDYHKSGTGSGGLVNVEYEVNILEGFKNNKNIKINEDLVKVYEKLLEEYPYDAGDGWTVPWCQYEPEVPEDEIKKAREKSEKAIIVLSRSAGEAKDCAIEKGSWYLSNEEERLLKSVTKYFEKTVVLLNIGNIMDMSWIEQYNIKSVMIIWQGGQEGGNDVADLVSGDVTPSGKLTDTIADSIVTNPTTANFGSGVRNYYQEDIYVGYRYYETFFPNKVLYPFGFGLSYTEFKFKNQSAKVEDGKIVVSVTVENVGDYKGKEIVQVYHSAPQGELGKPVRTLCGFKKTKLLNPGEEETLEIEFPIDIMASYDDSGVTGFKSAYVLEKGAYNIYVGNSVRNTSFVYSHEIGDTKVTQQLTEALAPTESFYIFYPVMRNGKFEIGYRKNSTRTTDYRARIKSELPKEIAFTGDKGIKLIDVKNGKNTMEEFVAQMTDEDLRTMAKGEGMNSPKVRPGSTGAIGGSTESLNNLGVPLIDVHDGPSGLRIDSGEKATSIPNGACIAASWNEELTQTLYTLLSVELCTHRIDSLLGPGINIHRSPLNGRNFEYFSEDPFLTGKIAASCVRGMATYGNSATIKHFCANSQEHSRLNCDSVMSERALREIYLRGFEIAVKEGNATSLMTAYNLINGELCCRSYDLNTTILKNEWGYKGFVMSDWWPSLVDETGKLHLSDMVEAQNDVFMLVPDALNHNDDLKESLENGKITRGQLQRNAINMLTYIMNSHTMERFVKFGGKLEKSLAEDIDNLVDVCTLENIENDKEIDLKIEKTGKHLFVVEYSSKEDELMQITANISINGTSASTVTVSGTNNKKAVVMRDISVSLKDSKLKFTYPENILKIEKVTLKTTK